MEYTSQKAQFGSYHNGINLSLSLSNDNDVVAITADGRVLGTLPSVVASVMKNGQLESTYTSQISVAPPEAPSGEEWEWIEGSEDSNYTWNSSTHTLTINKIPSGFSQGNFVFSKDDLSATFSLRTVQSNVDYNLVIDKTLINNTTSGGTIGVKVRKTKEDGTTEDFSSSGEVEVLYTVDVEGAKTEKNWTIQYDKYDDKDSSTYAPIKIELRQKVTEGEAEGFLWDWETIEFVQNGITPQDFNVTASAYAFVKGEDGKYENYITLTAHATNVSSVDIIKWYKDDVEITSAEGSVEYEATKPGTYKVVLGDWNDSVILSEIKSGATGADAVAITVINSSMTFNKNEESDFEECEVTVYEGANKILVTDIEYTEPDFAYDNGDISITKDGTNNKIIAKIINPKETGSYSFTITATLSTGEQIEETITVNWTAVEDGAPGESIYAIVEPNTLHKGSIPNSISVEIYKKVGDGAPTAQTGTFYYTYQIDGGQVSTCIETSGTISLQNIKNSLNNAKKIQFTFYSDASGTKLIDKATLEVLADGSDGASISGIKEYFLISDKSTGISRPGTDPINSDTTSPTKDTWYDAAIAPTYSCPYLWNYERIAKDDGTYIYTDAVAIGRYGKDGTNAYSLSLDNDYDSVVYTNNGDCISEFPIKVEARKYYGSSNQSYGTVFLKYSKNNGSFSTLTSNEVYTSSNIGSFFSFYQMADSKGAILEIKRLPSDFQEMSFVFEWHSSSNASSSTYDKNTFKLKKVTALADYDLVFPQTVYNTTDTSDISFTVLKKSVNGTTTLTTAPIDSTTGSENEVVAYYKKISNNDITYKKISNWSEVSKDDLKTSSVVLTSADGAGVTVASYSAFTPAPSITWDEETIEFVSNGSNGNSLEVKYTATENTPVYPASTGAGYSWGTTFPTVTGNKKVWMVQKLSNSTTWSRPVQVSSLDGAPGKDGSDIEFEYYRSQNEANFSSGIKEDSSGNNYYDKSADSSKVWTDSPSGITETNKYEYMIVRTKPSGTNTSFSNWSVPVIWSKWGDKGQDGDGVEYIYYLSNSSTAPGAPTKVDGKWKTNGIEWKNDPQGVDKNNQYEYVSKITVTTDANGNKKEEAGTPALWAKYANDAQAIRIVSDKHQFRFDQNNIPYDDQVATLTLQGSNIDTSKAGWLVDNEIVGTGSTIQVTPEVFEFGLELPNMATTGRLRFFYYHNGQAFSGDTVGNVYYTRNGSWIKRSLVTNEPFVGAAYYDDNYYIIGYNGSLYKYKYSNSSSVPTSVNNKPSGKFEAIVSNGSFMAIFGYIGENPYYWYLRQDGSWKEINVGTSDKFVAAEVINGNIYALTQKGKIYKIYSNNEASKHEQIVQVGSGTNWRCFYNTNDGYLVGNDSGAVYKIGSNSEEITIAGKTINRIRAIKYFNGYYYIAGYYTDGSSAQNGKIYRSKDLESWEQVSIEDSRAVWWLTIIRDRVLYCSGENGLLKKVSEKDSSFNLTTITAAVDGLADITSIIKTNDVPSNYVLSLSNDSATVAATKDGTVTASALEFATKTIATLYYGDTEETNVVYKWAVVNGTLIRTTGKEIYFTGMSADTATATVSAHLVINGTEQTTAVATKVFTVTKNKQGENAVSYKLLATPNRIQSGTNTAITFSVLKHDGSNTITIEQKDFGTNKIVIEVGDTPIDTSTHTTSDTTAYKLEVNGVYQDTEVVDAAPIIYTYDLATDINHMRVDDKKDITVYVVKSSGDKQENVSLGSEQVTIYKDGGSTGTTLNLDANGKLSAASFSTATNSLKIKYHNDDYGDVYATVTFYEDAERTYMLYYDSWTPSEVGGQIQLLPLAPTKSYSEYPESLTAGQTGWYTKYKETTYKDDDKTIVDNPGSVYRCVKVARASQEGSVDWGPVEKMNGSATTRADIFGLLNGEDGIYNEGGKIYVKANGIKSGALLVGELTKEGEVWKPGPDTVLYANVDDGDGTFWATKGKIGSMEIDAIGSALPTYGNENNLLTWHTVEGKKVVLLNETATTGGLSKISLASIQEKDGIITLYKDEDNTTIEKEEVFYRFCNPNTSTNFLHTMVKGGKYTLSGYIRIRKSSSKTISLKIRNQYYTNGTWQDAIEEEVWIKESDGENKWVYFSKSFVINNDAQGYYISLQVYGSGSSGNQGRFSGTDFGFKEGATIELSGLQLVEEKMSANVSGSYSWKFSPTEGIKMWKGPQTDTYKVFSIDSEGGLWMNGKGTFAGKIIAEAGGTIGGWDITDNSLTQKDTNNLATAFISGTGVQTDKHSVGDHKDEQNWLIWARGDAESADGSMGRFGIDATGAIYATKGKIGGVEINQIAAKTNENLASKNYIINTGVTVNSESYPIFNITKTVGTSGTYIALNNISPEEGKKYTLSYYFQASSGLKKIGGHTGGLDASKMIWTLDGIKQEVPYSTGVTLQDTKAHYVTVTFEAKNQISGDNNLYIQPNRQDSTPVTYKLWNIKLEKGDVATSYVKAGVDESGDLNAVSNNFSWKFSPTEGMFMWNGQPSTSTTDKTKGAVLAIYNAGTADQPKHKLALRGYIEAEGGRIGLLDIYSGKYDMAFRKSSPTSLSVTRTLKDFLPSSASSYYISGETSAFSPNKIAYAFNQDSMVGWNHGIDGKITIYKWAFSQTSSSPKYYAGRGFIHKTYDSLQITLPQKTNNTSAGYSDTRYFHILEIYDYYNAATPRMYTIYSKKANDPQATIQLPPGEYCFAFFGGVSNSSTAQALSLGQSEQEFLDQIDFKIYSTDFGISSDGGFWGKLSNNIESVDFGNFSSAANHSMSDVDLICTDHTSNTLVKIKENGATLRNSLGWLHQMAVSNISNSIYGVSNYISIGYECQTGKTICLYWGKIEDVTDKNTTITPVSGGTVLHAQVSLFGKNTNWDGKICPYVYSISGASFTCRVSDVDYGFLWLAIVAK